ncbi:hypothetical protein PENTCL1PPCAC_8189, partial [Pristionchus entomophagus]
VVNSVGVIINAYENIKSGDFMQLITGIMSMCSAVASLFLLLTSNKHNPKFQTIIMILPICCLATLSLHYFNDEYGVDPNIVRLLAVSWVVGSADCIINILIFQQ